MIMIMINDYYYLLVVQEDNLPQKSVPGFGLALYFSRIFGSKEMGCFSSSLFADEELEADSLSLSLPLSLPLSLSLLSSESEYRDIEHYTLVVWFVPDLLFLANQIGRICCCCWYVIFFENCSREVLRRERKGSTACDSVRLARRRNY